MEWRGFTSQHKIFIKMHQHARFELTWTSANNPFLHSFSLFSSNPPAACYLFSHHSTSPSPLLHSHAKLSSRFRDLSCYFVGCKGRIIDMLRKVMKMKLDQVVNDSDSWLRVQLFGAQQIQMELWNEMDGKIRFCCWYESNICFTLSEIFQMVSYVYGAVRTEAFSKQLSNIICFGEEELSLSRRHVELEYQPNGKDNKHGLLKKTILRLLGAQLSKL